MKIKHNCDKCAKLSKKYAEKIEECRKWYAKESKRYADKCRCGVE